MGYFSELSVTLQEQRELFAELHSAPEANDPSQARLLFWRLEDLKDRLKELLAEESARSNVWSKPGRDWRKVYEAWPEYWTKGRPDAFYILPRDLTSVADVLRAIASTQKRLLFCGHDADAEERKHSNHRPAARLEGQTSLALAS